MSETAKHYESAYASLTAKSMNPRSVESPGRAWAELEDADGGSEGGAVIWVLTATRFRRTPVNDFIDRCLSDMGCGMNVF
jgi:hypothetical protein